MAHYVCTGECGGVADHAKACESDGCSKKGQPLKECHCTDNEHWEVKAAE